MHESTNARLRSFWQRRFYNFNVWTRKKKSEKFICMHMNPVKRDLVAHPKDWRWSSYASYQRYPDAFIDVPSNAEGRSLSELVSILGIFLMRPTR